jgi:hypothetical protein
MVLTESGFEPREAIESKHGPQFVSDEFSAKEVLARHLALRREMRFGPANNPEKSGAPKDRAAEWTRVDSTLPRRATG